MAIRFDKKLNAEINKTLRNYNAKIRRLEKQNKDLELPERLNKKDLLDDVYSRRELKNKLKELRLYSKVGIERNVKLSDKITISEYEYTLMKRHLKSAKLKLTRQINEYKESKATILGKEADETFARMGRPEYLSAIAKRKALEKDIMKVAEDRDSYLRFRRLIENQNKRNRTNPYFKQNTLDLIMLVGAIYNIDMEKVEYICNTINENTDDAQFYAMFKYEKIIQAIIEFYHMAPPSGIDIEVIRDNVVSAFDLFYDELPSIIKAYTGKKI